MDTNSGSDPVTEEVANSEVKRRDTRVFELRIQGYTFEHIASELGFSGPSGAWKAYQRVKGELYFENVDEARQLELLRLDALQFAFWDRAVAGELPAASCVMKIIDRRIKLLGLDKPEKIEINRWDFDSADIDAEVKRLVTIMNEREEEFMTRREAEVRAEMRRQFEIEKKLEKQLQSSKSSEDAKTKMFELLEIVGHQDKIDLDINRSEEKSE